VRADAIEAQCVELEAVHSQFADVASARAQTVALA
jgi:hypothetical protein